MTAADPSEDRRFKPTSGIISGWLGVGLAAVVLISVLLDDHTVVGARVAFLAAVCGLLVWCFMLRPRLVIGSTELELRNAFTSWHVPLASVRRVAVRAVTRVYTDERRCDGVAVGRPVRSLMRARPQRQHSIGVPGLGGRRMNEDVDAARIPKGQLDADMVADLVVEQILTFADRAREAGEQPREPRRTWAWVELTLLVLLVVGLVVSLVT
jgi:hypothetical protein